MTNITFPSNGGTLAGTIGDDTAIGSRQGDSFSGGLGNDSFTSNGAETGQDAFLGGEVNDSASANGDGPLSFDGGEGDEGDDQISVSPGFAEGPVVNGGAGNDTLGGGRRKRRRRP